MTSHIEAKKEEIAKTVIMPGDPKRAQFIAENYLENYKKVNEVRGILAFTGTYKDEEITIMASGMGMPSIGIYSYELYHFYDVDTIIRVGSAGALDPQLDLYDLVLAEEAYSDSSFALVQNGTKDHVIESSLTINKKIKETAMQKKVKLYTGKVYSSDVFYNEELDHQKMYQENGCVATEMEAFALFHNARILHKNAACLLTISDSIVTGKRISPMEREKGFIAMIELVLEAVREIK